MKKYLFSIHFLVCCASGFTQPVTVSLDGNWQFRQYDSLHQLPSAKGTWHPATVPGTVHTDLLSNQLIPDPFYRLNEQQVQWVEDGFWWYRKIFDVSPALLQKDSIMLQFDGLDTYATVILNDSVVLTADNMFRQWKAEVKKYMKPTGNVLFVKFIPASLVAGLLKEDQHLTYPENERVFVRKAQYHFGWDWGPRLVTAGIWRPVRLTGWNASEHQPGDRTKNISLPSVQLVRERDTIGETFYFRIDGRPVFMKGANWVPPDNFLPRAKKLQVYQRLLNDAKNAGVNMLRVWGGGVYEDDIFYDLCDSLGIWVWQDFMFAGALYPADSAFVESVREEVRYQVTRLRHHPCIVLWCGNNEIEEAWFNWGWQKQFGYTTADSLRLWNDYHRIFHDVIPGMLALLDPGRPYWPSSPSTGWGRDSAYRKGDVHYWGVWCGKAPVEKYNEKVGRFNSEYGMQGLPDMKTIRSFARAKDLDTASAVMKAHQKHPFGYENIKLYINNEFHAPVKFEHVVYVSQLMQAHAMKTAIEAHRRNKPVTMGTLFWQWNDCWPVVSWSAIDYAGRKKALYYEVKRSFADVIALPVAEAGLLKVRLVSDADTVTNVIMETQVIHFRDGVLQEDTRSITLPPGGAMNLPVNIAGRADSTACIRLRLLDRQTGSLLSENVYFGVPARLLQLPESKISVNVFENVIEL
ncbi:MAG TPA: hypothetical protein VFZ78_10475, partial [Flavisolibacter sp.]